MISDYLIFRSAFLPRILGGLMTFAGFELADVLSPRQSVAELFIPPTIWPAASLGRHRCSCGCHSWLMESKCSTRWRVQAGTVSA